MCMDFHDEMSMFDDGGGDDHGAVVVGSERKGKQSGRLTILLLRNRDHIQGLINQKKN